MPRVMDAASAAMVRRLGACLAVVAAGCALARLLLGATANPSPVLTVGALTALVLAARFREAPGGASLNRWDEAIAHVGLAALSRVLG